IHSDEQKFACPYDGSSTRRYPICWKCFWRRLWKAAAMTNKRECGKCSLCCKLLPIQELNKPIDTWCPHCRPGHGGCTIYSSRPSECRVSPVYGSQILLGLATNGSRRDPKSCWPHQTRIKFLFLSILISRIHGDENRTIRSC